MKKLTAADVMVRKVLTVHPDWSLETLLAFFADHSITGAPVAAEDGRPIGVVSLTDIARSGSLIERRDGDVAHEYYRNGSELYVSRDQVERWAEENDPGVKVRDLMTPMVFTVDEDTTVNEIAETMITGRIHRVFVTEGKRIIGIVSSMDLLPLIRDL